MGNIFDVLWHNHVFGNATTQPVAAPAPPKAPRVCLFGRLSYLIGASQDTATKADGHVIVVPYDDDINVDGTTRIKVGYCNLFDEKNTGDYGPYLKDSDTAEQYGEGQIDARGAGFEKNLREQFERRRAQGFKFVELDNPDAYSTADVLRAYDLAAQHGLHVIAKNPNLCHDPQRLLRDPLVAGIIVERAKPSDHADPVYLDALRRDAGAPFLPVWFVTFGSGLTWAHDTTDTIKAKGLQGMGVTYSSIGEYGNVVDIQRPL